ncbi:hypothetical protein Tcan_01531, partial [Toxocara canis]
MNCLHISLYVRIPAFLLCSRIQIYFAYSIGTLLSYSTGLQGEDRIIANKAKHLETSFKAKHLETSFTAQARSSHTVQVHCAMLYQFIMTIFDDNRYFIAMDILQTLHEQLAKPSFHHMISAKVIQI